MQQDTARRPLIVRLRQWALLAGVTLFVILVDQLSKAYVVAHLDHGASWMPVGFLEPVFRFTHVHNKGAAFGLFPEGSSLFLIIALVVSVVIVYYYRKLPDGNLLLRVAMGLQMGGALGNVIDRIRLGYVIDFFHVDFWPVFNVSDSCIVLGVALLTLELLREEYRIARQQQAEDCPPPDKARDSSEETSCCG
ncbi:MAG: signal peptidase II [Anaerolineae bacterium]|nr:signal peptidase II [Anaerolineae bacterium]